jgi:hypothetical protein
VILKYPEPSTVRRGTPLIPTLSAP